MGEEYVGLKTGFKSIPDGGRAAGWSCVCVCCCSWWPRGLDQATTTASAPCCILATRSRSAGHTGSPLPRSGDLGSSCNCSCSCGCCSCCCCRWRCRASCSTARLCASSCSRLCRALERTHAKTHTARVIASTAPPVEQAMMITVQLMDFDLSAASPALACTHAHTRDTENWVRHS